MQELIKKIEELKKALLAMKPKENSLVPALSIPPVKPLSISAVSSAMKKPELPGVATASTKDPKKMAEQLKNPRPKKPKIEVLKTDKNGQWSLDKAAEKIRVSDKLADLTGKGTEHLVDQHGNIRASFQDGNMPRPSPNVSGKEATVPLGKFGENNSV